MERDWLHSLAPPRLALPDELRAGDVRASDLTPAYSPHPVVAVAGTLPIAGRPRPTLGLACRATVGEAIRKAWLEWTQGTVFIAARGTDRAYRPHALNGRVVRYDATRHAVQDVGPSPEWVRLREVPAADAEPAVVPALVLADQPVLAEYGQRGGRFGLLEAGAAAQSVCLRMAQQRLGGHLLGGAADADVLALLGLRGQPVRVAAVIACGPTFTRR